MIKKFLIKLFKLETTYKVEFSPVKRDIDKNVLFLNPIIAREFHDFIRNYMSNAVNDGNLEAFGAYKKLLSDLKILSENHGSKINFDIPKKV